MKRFFLIIATLWMIWVFEWWFDSNESWPFLIFLWMFWACLYFILKEINDKKEAEEDKRKEKARQRKMEDDLHKLQIEKLKGDK